MKGLVIINAYPKGEKFYRQGERIAEELEKLGVKTEVKRNGSFLAATSSHGVTVRKDGVAFAVYLDKDKYLGEMLEKAGLRLFNRPKAVAICDDKMTTFLSLIESGVKIPKTIAAPLCYTAGVKPDLAFLEAVAKELAFPLVAKKCYGSFGEAVKLVHGMPELKKIANEWLFTPHLFQEYIAESSGRDFRVIVVGGKAIGCMERTAQKGEFRSNIELGGQGRRAELTDEYRDTAELAAKTLGLDYCGVDLLESDRGPILCEVNSNAFFEGFEAVTGINVAKAYAEYIVETMKNGRE